MILSKFKNVSRDCELKNLIILLYNLRRKNDTNFYNSTNI